MASALSLLEIEIEIIENSLRRQRVFRDQLNPMEAYSDFDFIARYRITKYMFVNLSRCVTAATKALTSIAPAYINFPNTTRQRVIQEYFLKKYKFPLVLGCIDGSHVPILAPSTNEDIYVNRKGFHSINIQAICDHEFRFINAVVKWPGCTHDAFIWRQSGINREITSGGIETVHGW